jgi:alkanesulfonate monooxygenase SsuD/methylene tetrahydromethanopterin reductase-like flavin-dependent oxidoreductase (luciferase family)
VRIDVLFDPFAARWHDVRDGAKAAEAAGFDGIWLYDHLAGAVHEAPDVLECWTTLSALATTVTGLSLGPLVLNVANRDPATLAVMAATLQEVSAGRLLLGLGAGGGRATPYAAEQEALGREVPGDIVRRRSVEQAIATLRTVWSGTVGPVWGFLRPEPAPPIVVGGFGPKMAELAGRLGDGINAPAGPRFAQLVDIARRAHAGSGRSAEPFVVTASAGASRRQLDGLGEMGVDRAVIYVAPPYTEGVERIRAAITT